MHRCGPGCAMRSCACSARRPSPRCSSLTTRKKRCHWATGSRSCSRGDWCRSTSRSSFTMPRWTLAWPHSWAMPTCLQARIPGMVSSAPPSARSPRIPDPTRPAIKVTAMVRPERVVPVLGRKGRSSLTNLFQGKISNDRFLGAVRRYDLAVEGGVIQGETTVRDPISTVSIAPEAVRLLSTSSMKQLQQRRIPS